MFAKIFNGAPQRHWLPLVSLSFFASVPVFASDLEPRSYVHIPVGLSFLGVSYAHSTGDLSPAPSSPLKNASLTMDGVGIGASRTFALLGSSAKADLAVPHVCYNGEAEINGSPQSAKRCETGDPLLRLNWNFWALRHRHPPSSSHSTVTGWSAPVYRWARHWEPTMPIIF